MQESAGTPLEVLARFGRFNSSFKTLGFRIFREQQRKWEKKDEAVQLARLSPSFWLLLVGWRYKKTGCLLRLDCSHDHATLTCSLQLCKFVICWLCHVISVDDQGITGRSGISADKLQLLPHLQCSPMDSFPFLASMVSQSEKKGSYMCL